MLFFRVCNYAAKLRIKSKTTKNNVITPIPAHSTIKCNFLNYTPAGASLQLVPNSEFKILSLSHQSHNCPYIPSLLSLPIPPTSPILPTRPTCRIRPTIHKFPSHYLKRIIGLKTLFSMVGKEK